jgi:hypothetical protein
MSSTEISKPRRRRGLIVAWLAVYCVALLLVGDFLYTRFVYARAPTGRVADPDFHHGLAANFSGYEPWGDLRPQLITNSLGLRDASMREVPAKPATRRIILIGDSFTEGLGMNFEESFAGLLHAAGQARAEKTEFLNAGVTSYSPVIYYKKIKRLLDAGVRFDELVVLSDISDVNDEATSYFCIDEHAEYRRLCATLGNGANERWTTVSVTFGDFFFVTNRAVTTLWNRFNRQGEEFERLMYARGAWTLPDSDVRDRYAPLGVEGGIERSLRNMASLAALLEKHRIALTLAVYPYPVQLGRGDRDSRQVRIWRDFCANRCRAFIDMFPAFFAIKDADPDWNRRLFIAGDVHLSAEGNRLAFRLLANHLL